MELLFSGVLSLGSVAYFHRLATQLESESDSRAALQAYGPPDIVFTTLLVLWFLTNIIGSANRVVELNSEVLIVGALFSLLLIAIVLSFLTFRSQNPMDLFGLRGVSVGQTLKAGCFGLIAALPAVYFIHSLCLLLMHADATPQPLLQFLKENATAQDRALLILTALIVAPLAEELIFRGYVFGVLRRYTGRWWAMAISALVFAAIHAHLPSFAGLFALAIALTLVYEVAGSLWAAILMHSLFNAITVLFTLVWPDVLN
ncbi:MAG TPA: type II CAAX endopeptidase family protein [Terrimicrobiaceae bacterium]